jgi:hypothetical protein
LSCARRRRWFQLRLPELPPPHPICWAIGITQRGDRSWWSQSGPASPLTR